MLRILASLLTSLLIVVALALPPRAAVAADVPDDLPTVTSGQRPGPDALYLPAPDAPQLQNTGPWRAEPLLISGAAAYRDGEWLYQDFLFDDHGATGTPPQSTSHDPYGISTNLYSPTGGTFLYPTAEEYAHNAADLVELRVKPLADATAFRVTLNTMVDPALAAFTIALGDATSGAAWPHGAGVSGPAEVFVTWHGDVPDAAGILDAAGTEVTPAATASVDLARRQIEVRVPRAAWDPGTGTHRVTVGVGLWDADAGIYLAPQPGSPTESTPGGGTPQGVALVNVGPRFDEPTPFVAGYTMGDTAAGAKLFAPWWRERLQSQQLTQGDVSPFFAEVDFAALAAGTDDESAVPTSGPMNRIMASRYVFGQGLEPDNVCFGISAGIDVGAECIGRYVGQLQPYAIYVPDQAPPAEGFPLTLLMHSLSANYNQYLGTNNQIQLGEAGTGSIVVTPEARGPDGFYKGIPEANTFEVWADVARHYPLDPDRARATGYSMGGYGTYRLLARWPDLFERGFSVVGIPGSALDQVDSHLNHEILAWNASADELVNIASAEEAHEALITAGIDHDYWQFPQADHLTLAANDEYGPGAAWLSEAPPVDRAPPTVRYVVDPAEDSRDVVADHAYWLSGLEVRDPEASPTGTVEVHSHGFGVGPSTAQDRDPGGGALTGGQNQAMPYVTRGVERIPGEATPAADKLTVTATNVGRVVVDPTRARVSCDAEVEVESDGPIEVVLAGCTDAAPAPVPAEDAGSQLPATGGGLALVGLVGIAVASGLRTSRSRP